MDWVFGGEINNRICSNYSLRHYKLTQRLIHQGFRYSSLCIAFWKFAKKHTQVLGKYGRSVRRHIEDGCMFTKFLRSYIFYTTCV